MLTSIRSYCVMATAGALTLGSCGRSENVSAPNPQMTSAANPEFALNVAHTIELAKNFQGATNELPETAPRLISMLLRVPIGDTISSGQPTFFYHGSWRSLNEAQMTRATELLVNLRVDLELAEKRGNVQGGKGDLHSALFKTQNKFEQLLTNCEAVLPSTVQTTSWGSPYERAQATCTLLAQFGIFTATDKTGSTWELAPQFQSGRSCHYLRFVQDDGWFVEIGAVGSSANRHVLSEDVVSRFERSAIILLSLLDGSSDLHGTATYSPTEETAIRPAARENQTQAEIEFFLARTISTLRKP